MAASIWSCWPPTILQEGRRPLCDTPAPRHPLKEPVLASRVIEPRFFLIFLLTVLPDKEKSEDEDKGAPPIDPNCLATLWSCLEVLLGLAWRSPDP